MKMFTILKNMLTLIQSVKSLITDNSTLKNGYVVFPNSVKICWGYFSNQAFGGKVPLPISFQDGYAIVLPEYSYTESWRVQYSCSHGAYQGSLTLYPFDTQTHNNSASTKLSGIFIIIGY